jgi:hypothetical protein
MEENEKENEKEREREKRKEIRDKRPRIKFILTTQNSTRIE